VSDSVCVDSLLVKLLCRDWFGRLDRRYGPIDADCCCNQRLLTELPLSSIADADATAAVLADAVVAASYRYGLILCVVAAASIDLSNQRLLIKLPSPIVVAISVN